MTGERPISRWSRLKREERAVKTKRGGAALKEQETPDATQASLPPERAPKETATDGGKALPSVESLTKDSDFTAFMKPGVPEDVSQAAMRKLWKSDPVFAEIDPLNDGFGDYRNFPLITLKDTIYQVGKGIIDWAAEDEKEAAAAAAAKKSAPAAGTESEEKKTVAQTAEQAAPPMPDGGRDSPADPVGPPSGGVSKKGEST
ncbi:MAG: DUF3306 domain-containing protein [Rhodospirillales bacterium]|nr:DUF3306 domain-containing protein [Rhodospirillales bacterium]